MKFKEKGGKETGYECQESFVFIVKEKLLSYTMFQCQELQYLPRRQAEHLLSYYRGVKSGWLLQQLSGTVIQVMYADLFFLQKFSHGALTLCSHQLFGQLFGWTMCLFVLSGIGTIPSLDTEVVAGIFPLTNPILQKTASSKMIRKKTAQPPSQWLRCRGEYWCLQKGTGWKSPKPCWWYLGQTHPAQMVWFTHCTYRKKVKLQQNVNTKDVFIYLVNTSSKERGSALANMWAHVLLCCAGFGWDRVNFLHSS